MTRYYSLFLILILFFSIAVRLWGLNWGLPDKWHLYYSYHPDEAFHLEWALGLYDGMPIPRAFMNGGTFYQSILKFSDFIGYRLPDTISAIHLYKSLLVARLFSLVAGAITVVLTFYIARELCSRKVALLASLFLAIVPAHVFSSQQAKPDIIMAMFTTAAILFSLKLYDSKRILWYALAGIMVGMACGTKISAVPFLFSPLFAHILKYGNFRSILKKEVFIIMVSFGAGYLLASPYTLTYPESFYQGLKIQYYYQSGIYEESLNRGPGWFHYLTRILPYSLGIPILFASLIGLVITAVRKEKRGLILLSGLIPYYVLISWGSWITIRYTMPLLPILNILAACAFISFVEDGKSHVVRAVLLMILLSTVVYTFLLTAAYDRMLSRKDTRTMASEWIEANIKKGSTIGLAISYEGDEFFNPPISPWNYRVQYQILRETNDISPFLSYPFDYIIINELQYIDYMRLGERFPDQNAIRFFDHVTKSGRLRLIKEFKKRPNVFGIDISGSYPPSELIIPSPTVRIYQLVG